MLPKISNDQLEAAFNKYKQERNIKLLLDTAGLWIMNKARYRYRLDEDELSEVFIHFYENGQKCIEFFERNHYISFPAYLSVYTKHLAFSTYKRRKQIYNEEYLGLWSEGMMIRDYIPHILDNTHRIRMHLKELCSMGRIIVSLRFNLKLEIEDLKILYKNMTKPIEVFHQEYEDRIHRMRAKREDLNLTLNKYNHRIINSSNSSTHIYRARKQRIINSLLDTYILYSIKEISDLLAISRHQTGRLYRRSMEVLRDRIYAQNEENDRKESFSIAA
ncbi:MAG TPA: hypothetical protein PK079_14515 [Leptospiraceae bacterium]|nr:hypothetical protein [Leptospiraceae bacterium]HMW07722.1 hypothetical protein [Leptospiraceae bacterium]HMX32008.1 hypothetical protein [Leptospiraceae bacterium]HMY33388.1 hypothetical protein [Leptospiraceae bacterium]HMZ64804.1 hypothetical protein [Leptospiraceae bacterium]